MNEFELYNVPRYYKDFVIIKQRIYALFERWALLEFFMMSLCTAQSAKSATTSSSFPKSVKEKSTYINRFPINQQQLILRIFDQGTDKVSVAARIIV